MLSSRNSKVLSAYKKDLLDIYFHAIDAVRPDRLVKNAVSFRDNVMTIKDRTKGRGDDVQFDLRGRQLHVIGGGKCVLGMARGLAEVANQAGVTQLFSHGALSVPLGLKVSLERDTQCQSLLSSIGIKCLFGSENNLPDQGSVSASKSILNSVTTTTDVQSGQDNDKSCQPPLFIVLISGGGSACLTSPKYIGLDQKLALIKALVQKGADIVELNKVRRYFSNIKGGQLASHILRSHPGSQIVSLILSDVIGDPIEFIASGPTFIQDSTSGCSGGFGVNTQMYQSMLEILNKYDIADPLIGSIRPQENDDDVQSDAIFATELLAGQVGRAAAVTNLIVGNNTIALEAAIGKANQLGYSVECLGNELQGFSELVVEKFIEFGDHLFEVRKANRGSVLVVGGGEATINKVDGDTWGKGGRAQEMALDYMMAKMKKKLASDEQGPRRKLPVVLDVFLAGGTDGQDGPSEVAACMASCAEWAGEIEEEAGETTATGRRRPHFTLNDVIEAKRAHDSYNFWKHHKPEWLVVSGLTGTNVMDLYFYLVTNN